jgi:hypothetical protein
MLLCDNRANAFLAGAQLFVVAGLQPTMHTVKTRAVS